MFLGGEAGEAAHDLAVEFLQEPLHGVVTGAVIGQGAVVERTVGEDGGLVVADLAIKLRAHEFVPGRGVGESEGEGADLGAGEHFMGRREVCFLAREWTAKECLEENY